LKYLKIIVVIVNDKENRSGFTGAVHIVLLASSSQQQEKSRQRVTVPDADVVALLGRRHGRAARTTEFLEVPKQELAPIPW